MNTPIDWKTLFISAEGRLSRVQFWIAAAILLVIMFVYEGLVAGAAALHWITGWLVYVAALFFGTCVLAKRFHDRGRSGWFALPTLFAVVGVWTGFNSPADTIFLIILIWAAVETVFLTGEVGANRFGASPLAATA
jgi:uncharacterized membrane protein YhaH (DUF805 family)